jgi:hypothetical protein
MPNPDLSRLLLDAPRIGAQLCEQIPAWRALDPARLVVHQSRRRVSRKTEEAGAPYLGVAYGWTDAAPQAPWLYLRAHSRGTSAEVAAGSSALHLPELDAVAWLLPDEPALGALAHVLDGDTVAALLPGAGEGMLAWRSEGRARIVRYEPESHCTVRYVMRRGDETRTVYGKCHADDRWQANAALLMALWPYGLTDRAAFEVARPLGGHAGLRVLWQKGVEGLTLRETLAGPEAAPWLGRVVSGLQQLQSIHALSQARLDAGTLFARTTKQALKLQRAEPSLGAQLQPLLAELARLPADGVLVNVHGDFHVDQLLCREQRLVLLDFDNFALGHTAHDLADCASQLLVDIGFATGQRRALARQLIALGREAFDRRLSEDALHWHLRVLLLRKAYSFFVRHAPDWAERAREAIALARQGLAALEDDAACRCANEGVIA